MFADEQQGSWLFASFLFDWSFSVAIIKRIVTNTRKCCPMTLRHVDIIVDAFCGYRQAVFGPQRGLIRGSEAHSRGGSG